MGNTFGTTSNTEEITEESQLSNTNYTKEDENNILMDNIVNISLELLKKYNQQFLKEDFCKDFALVTDEQLNKMSLPVVQDLADKIESSEPSQNIRMILQYEPNEDDKFFVEGFEKQLKDYFWNQNLVYSSSFFEKEGLSTQNLDMNSLKNLREKQKIRYIDFNKINDLLRDFQNNNTNNKVGGANNRSLNQFEKNLFKGFKKNSSKNSVNSNNRKLKVEIVKNNSESLNNNVISKKIEESLLLSNNSNNKKNNIKNLIKSVNNEIKNKRNFENKNTFNKRPNMNQIKNTMNKVVSKNNNLNQKINLMNQLKMNKQNTNLLKNNNMEQKGRMNYNNNKSKMINMMGMNMRNKSKFVRYTIPRDYQQPEQLCIEGVEKCSLKKKELCKVIRDNLIIRCNIIAAILNVLPNHKVNGEYTGGYLYSKFVNLAKCQVCVPDNFKELMDQSPEQLIKHVIQYSDFLDAKSCKDNGGYYLRLTKREMEALYDNVPKSENLETMTSGKKINYNLFYIECAKKLKESYFENLKVLVEILQTLKDEPFISNQVLNELGEKAKNIIESMYHLCQYYYIFAIISLLNANITPTKDVDRELQNKIESALKKKDSKNEEESS